MPAAPNAATRVVGFGVEATGTTDASDAAEPARSLRPIQLRGGRTRGPGRRRAPPRRPSEPDFRRGIAALVALADRPRLVDALEVHVELPEPRHVLEHLFAVVRQMPVVRHEVAQREAAVAARVDRPHLDVRLAMMDVVLPRQRLPHVLIAGIVVDRRHLERVAHVVVEHREQAHLADQMRRQVLRDEALVLEVAHRIVERRQPRAARELGEPLVVLFGRRLADPADVAHHRKAERVRIDPAVVRLRHGRLVDHVAVRMEELHHEAVRELALVVHRVEQRVVPERRPTLVHHLRLPLRIEVLADLAHDPDHLALPRFEERRVLLREIQQVFLRLGRIALFLLLVGELGLLRGQRAPQLVDLRLQIRLALAPELGFLRERRLLRPLVAVDAVIHQRVARVEQFLDAIEPVALLAFGDVVLRVHEIIDDRVRVGPQPEQVVALEERVVPVRRVRDDERLHRHRVLFHQIRDARVRVDDDLVREPHLPAAVALLGRQEVLAERPVTVVHGHSHRRIRVHHLLGADQLELDRIDVELVLLRDLRDVGVVLLDQLERPIGRTRQRFAVGNVHTRFLEPARGRFWVLRRRFGRCVALVRGGPRRFVAPAPRLVAARLVVQVACRHQVSTCFSKSSRNTG
ncbi:hypothetical protein BURPS1710b_2028 [Burkholderia pseudomallei 1710b]|uniref:Uncharacterized protein n=1 Tax=Burkholderia pseudomallei (strain 1710b) TaxID=320372 RepID=Q3JSN1_BURP1|nr:hypothetical protein BURPS1710b_2028 [Burkholderia pseudomallei 1710b]